MARPRSAPGLGVAGKETSWFDFQEPCLRFATAPSWVRGQEDYSGMGAFPEEVEYELCLSIDRLWRGGHSGVGDEMKAAGGWGWTACVGNCGQICLAPAELRGAMEGIRPEWWLDYGVSASCGSTGVFVNVVREAV